MRALGIDYGARRIGLALSDATGLLARPWKTVPRTGNPTQVARALATEVASLGAAGEDIGVVVLGLPRRLDGTPNDQTPQVQMLAECLRAELRVPLVLQDERLSSHEAEIRLVAGEKDWRKRKARLDAMAAAVILQDYLDHQERRAAGAEDQTA